MSDDTLTKVCEDLLQLRDEVAQSEFRPSAETICERLGVIASRIDLLEACYSQPHSGEDHEITPTGSETHPEGTKRKRGRPAHAKASK